MHYEKFQDGTVKCIEDEIPFIIPETWEWTRLNVISSFELGKALDSAKNRGVFRPYLRSVNVRWNQIDLSDINEMKIEDNELERYSIKKGDLLICEGGDVGRSCVWNSDQVIYYQNALHRVRFYENIDPYFYMYIMMYYTFTGKLLEICKGVTIKHLTRATLQSLLFPLPPLNECVRITNKIKEVDNYISSLNNANDDILELIQITKAKILGLAIQGKLVPQNPDDEPASILLERIRKEKEELIKEGKLKREKKESIIYKGDDNSYYMTGKREPLDLPFILPNGWSWVTLHEIVFFQEGPGILKKDFRDNGIPLIRISGLQTKRVTLEGCNYLDPAMVEEKWAHFKLKKGDIVICTSASIGKVSIVDEEAVGAIPYTGQIRFQMTSAIHKDYFLYFAMSKVYLEQVNLLKTGNCIQHYGPTHLKQVIVPLPPFNEQIIIAKTLSNYLTRIDSINNNLK